MKFTTSIVAALGLVSSAMAAPAERSSDAETYEVSHVVARTGRSIVLTFQAAPVIFDLTIPLGTNEYDAKWVPTNHDLNVNIISFGDRGFTCHYKFGKPNVVLARLGSGAVAVGPPAVISAVQCYTS